MGATTFVCNAQGRNAREAFASAVTSAKYDYGHAGYTGTIAEKGTFNMIPLPPDREEGESAMQRAYRHAYDLLDKGDSRIDESRLEAETELRVPANALGALRDVADEYAEAGVEVPYPMAVLDVESVGVTVAMQGRSATDLTTLCWCDDGRVHRIKLCAAHWPGDRMTPPESESDLEYDEGGIR